MIKSYKGCLWVKSKKRKEYCGWTYAEMQKIWRENRKEAKLNKGWVRPSFKEWRDRLTHICPSYLPKRYEKRLKEHQI